MKPQMTRTSKAGPAVLKMGFSPNTISLPNFSALPHHRTYRSPRASQALQGEPPHVSVLCPPFSPLLSLALLPLSLTRRLASSAQTAQTTSLSLWSEGSRRRRLEGGRTWYTAGKPSSTNGQSLTGIFTMKVGYGQGAQP